jgi:hypothetical protein
MIAITIISSILYSIYFINNYPIAVTNRISFDAKISFIKKNIDRDSIDTIIVGSSIGLNNVRGKIVEDNSKTLKGVLNLSVYEATPPQIEQILQLTPLFINLKYVIYSAQFSDFAYAGKFKNYDSKFIINYIANKLSLKEQLAFYFKSCQNIFFCIERQWSWEKEHQQSNKFTYLGFDSSGSVPLDIYGNDIIKSRWDNPHSNRESNFAFKSLKSIAKELHKKGIKLIFVMQPYREPLIKKFKHLKPTMSKFERRVKDILYKNGGEFLNLNDKLHLQDKYFADRSHLNAKGSRVSSIEIAKFIDKEVKE